MNKEFLKNFHPLFYNDLFSIINEKQLPYSIRNYDKEEMIVFSGDYCSSVGIVLKGQIRIEQLLSSGKKEIIKILNQYDIFGEILLFSDHQYYPYNIQAINNCEILFITKTILLKIFKEDLNLLEKYLYHISKSYMTLNKYIKLKSQKTIISKLSYYLLYYAHITENQLTCKIDSKTHMSQILGVERQSLIRELNRLKDNGRLTYDRKCIYIKDFNYFKQLIE